VLCILTLKNKNKNFSGKKKQQPKKPHLVKKTPFRMLYFLPLGCIPPFLPHLFKTTSSNVVFHTP
jgi:hypothetical protein